MLGIRPEHISVARAARRLRRRLGGARPPAKVPATIDVVEPLGHRVVVTARSAAGPFQLETEIHAGVRPHEAVDLWFDMNRAYLFDRRDGARAVTLPERRRRSRRHRKGTDRLPRLPLLDREAPLGYCSVLPAVLYLALFIAYPFFMAIYMSLTDAQAGNQKWTSSGATTTRRSRTTRSSPTTSSSRRFPKRGGARRFAKVRGRRR